MHLAKLTEDYVLPMSLTLIRDGEQREAA